jgi:hypothetical protein
MQSDNYTILLPWNYKDDTLNLFIQQVPAWGLSIQASFHFISDEVHQETSNLLAIPDSHL